MNNLKYNQPGGFRLSTNILAAAQAAYSLFNSLGWIAGDKTIITGCDIVGSTVTDGVVFINGELFTFKGGNIGTNVIIRENVTKYPFKDGVFRDVIFERYVTFGTSTPENNYLWSDFKRIFQTKDIQTFKDDHNTRITQLEGKQAFFVGMIIRYDQPLDVPPPPGWVDWIPEDEQGRVWASRSDTDPEFSLHYKGGAKTVTLTQAQIPSKTASFTVKDPYAGAQSSGGFDGGGNVWKDRNISINVGGNDQSHNNMQPYIAVRFIKYVGF